MMEWHAEVARELGRDAERLFLWRDRGQGYDYLAADGSIQYAEHASGAEVVAGVTLPRGASAALARFFAPEASEGEIARLTEALDVERRRVDAVLGWIPGLTIGDPS